MVKHPLSTQKLFKIFPSQFGHRKQFFFRGEDGERASGYYARLQV